MTDKEYEKQKARVKKFWDKWFVPLGLGWFKVKLVYERVADDDEPLRITATYPHWQYRRASVYFYLPLCAEHDDERVEDTVVHEMIHILLAGLHNMDDEEKREITEYTTETLARAVMWAREAGFKEGQKK